MNYLSHGYRFLDDPWFVAGTAVPDWLSVVNRRMRARSRLVKPVIDTTQDPDVRSLGLGILQHHHDDAVFHTCEAFVKLEATAAGMFRQLMPDRFDHRPGFLGHIVVELLLDTIIEEQHPGILDRYYEVLNGLDFLKVQQVVNSMATRTSDKLAWFLQRFHEEQFLQDYLTNQGLLFRLNQVMKRVKLPRIPDEALGTLGELRPVVRAHASQMLDAVKNSAPEN